MKIKGLLIGLLLLLFLIPLGAQTFFVNNGDGNLMSLDINGCTSQFEESVGSFTDITYHPDGNFYLIKTSGQLYRLNAGGTSTYLTTFPGQGIFVALTADADGIIYGASLEGSLHAYQPATNTQIPYPNMGYGSSGDLTFYQGDLYMASTDNTLVRIDPNNPSNNSVFIDFSSANATIYGIVSYVNGCEAQTYASSNDPSSRIYEIDWQNQAFNYICTVPYRINGGASTYEFEASQQFIEVDEPQITQTGCGATVATLSITANSPNGGVTYSLNGGTAQTSGIFPNLPFGDYTLWIEDATGCTHYEYITIEGDDGIAIGNINVSPATCGEDNGSISIIADSPSGGLMYSINGGTDFFANAYFQDLPPGQYDIMIMDAIGCSISEQATVTETASFELLEVAASNASCGEQNGSINVEVESNGNAVFYSLDGNDFSTFNVFDGLSSGDYTLYIKDENDCSLEQTITLEGSEELVLGEVSVQAASCANTDGSISIQATGGNSSLIYTLDDRQNNSGNFQNLTSGDYTISVSSTDGCEIAPFIATMEDSCDIYIPNVFSPNSNGYNDCFCLFSPSLVEIEDMWILDRWGGIIYRRSEFFSNELNGGWDGTTMGIQAPIGVYAYVFHVNKDGEKLEFRGEFTLLR